MTSLSKDLARAPRGAGVAGSANPGLDWFNLLLSGMGGAYGAFIPVYLSGHAWTQTHIGVLLTVGTVASILCQVPAGLLVDAFTQYRGRILAFATVAMGALPFVLAVAPTPLPVLLAMVLQAVAGSLLTPGIAATSLSLAGRAALGERLGRNSRYGSIGAGAGAAVLGACGAWFPERTVFVIAACLTVPALLALRAIRTGQSDAVIEPGPVTERETLFSPFAMLKDRRVAVFALCIVLFQTASIAVLQLAAVSITARLGSRASPVIAACLIVPQAAVAFLSPWLGRAAERFGRRTVLLAGFATVPLRGALFALVRNPYALVPVQALEGAGGAVFGIMLPLVAADLTRGKGHYTLCLSLLGLASGLGTAISTALAGWVADGYGRTAAYWVMAAAGLAALVLVALAMPETRDDTPPGSKRPEQ